jgi:hypothetical protein
MKEFSMARHTTPAVALFLAGLISLATPALADDAKPPLPMPDDASGVTYDGESGSLTFSTAKPVKDVAALYRDFAKQHGWKEQPSVINKDNMAVLTFMAGGDNVANITVMKMGEQSQVTAEGPALESKGGTGEQAQAADPAGATPTAAPPLVAIDKDGLPIPDGLGNMGSTRTAFSHAVNFSAPNSVADIVAFYRAELGKKGWKEDSAKIADTEAELSFTTPDGPAKLVVKRGSDMSDAELTVTEKAKAAASPLAPKPGMVKLVFGNMSDKAADVTIAGKHVKMTPGQGAKGPDGPTLEVKPGKLSASVKGAKPEDFEAGPDEIWMVGVGPGGLMVVKQ